MMKKIPCPKCDGRGHVAIIGENSISGYRCEECFGTGQIEVPLTNADRIRAMTDEELAEYLCEINGCQPTSCPGAEMCKYGDGKSNGLKKWLKQPVKEGADHE